MRNLILPFLILLALAFVTLATLRHDAPMPPTLPVAKPRPSADVQQARELLSAHLGGPADLRIEGVRPSREPSHRTVLCGRAAWNANGYMRFIAAKRGVIIDGLAPDFDDSWEQICNGSPNMGAPPQTPPTT